MTMADRSEWTLKIFFWRRALVLWWRRPRWDWQTLDYPVIGLVVSDG